MAVVTSPAMGEGRTVTDGHRNDYIGRLGDIDTRYNGSLCLIIENGSEKAGIPAISINIGENPLHEH